MKNQSDHGLPGELKQDELRKPKLRKWLHNFLEVSGELSDTLKAGILFGFAQVLVPSDVFEVLKKEKVIFEKKPGRWLFVFQEGATKSYIEFLECAGTSITIRNAQD